MAISASNTGGAWDNAKKYIAAGNLKINGKVRGKGTDEHKAAIIGDTVGDPLKVMKNASVWIVCECVFM
eukprot:85617-Amorphochlora_amoeboformis.AAC.1